MSPFRFEQYINSKVHPQCVWLQSHDGDETNEPNEPFRCTNVYWVYVVDNKPSDVVVEVIDWRGEGGDYHEPSHEELSEVKRLTQDYLDSNRVEQQP